MTDHTAPSTPERDDSVLPLPKTALAAVDELEDWQEPEAFAGSVGRTMFDAPGSKDNTLTVLLPADQVQQVPAQSMLRIVSHPDGRSYLGIVVAGPFAEPDGLRADAPAVVTTTVRGGIFMPRYHGRVQVEILGEQLATGTLVPPRFRPLPNSPVFVLGSAETADVLKIDGTLALGVAAGDENMQVSIPADRKSVLPRHTGILGTTGGGKSTTVSRLIDQAAAQDYAVVLLDTEGEYTTLNEPTADPVMLAALQRRGLDPHGVGNTHLYRLRGKETSNPDHPDVCDFTLSFANLSPFTVEEILDLPEAQKERFSRAYDTAKLLLREFGIFPRRQGTRFDPDEDRQALELNEFETGYPHMRLDHVLDVTQLFHAAMAKEPLDEVRLLSPDFSTQQAKVIAKIEEAKSKTSHVLSWRGLLGRLWRLRRLAVFDQTGCQPLDCAGLLVPGRVSIFDLSDTDSPLLNNLVIADILRGTQRCQEDRYRTAERGGQPLTKVLIIIEEAHEFLSEERIAKMPNLFEQVTRIAKRGRKRWLGLVFVTQLPQHLPRQVLGLVNNFVLHKINDATTISRLKGSIAGIDDALWQRLPGLAPGQAIVSFTSMARPLMVAVDPAPSKLRMID
jgi:hypothetical protein